MNVAEQESLVTISYKESIAEPVEPPTGAWLQPGTRGRCRSRASAWLQPGTRECVERGTEESA
jgi:hypothetical protein